MSGSWYPCPSCGTLNPVTRQACKGCRKALLVVLAPPNIRVDRVCAPYWRALPEDERTAIEAAVPEGHRLTALARTGAHDITARLLRETGPGEAVLVRAVRGRDLARTMRAALVAP